MRNCGAIVRRKSWKFLQEDKIDEETAKTVRGLLVEGKL
jgi:hypothetical protein